MAHYSDEGGWYKKCRCPKSKLLRWDPHPHCVRHAPSYHYDEVLRDLDRDGPPTCDFCKTIQMSQRLRWIQLWEDHHGRGDGALTSGVNKGANATSSREASYRTPSRNASSHALSREASYQAPNAGGAANVGSCAMTSSAASVVSGEVSSHGANSRRASFDYLPPSGTVNVDWSAEADPPNPTVAFDSHVHVEENWDEDCDNDSVGEGDSPPVNVNAPNTSKDNASAKVKPDSILALFREVFPRACAVATLTPEPARDQNPVVSDFAVMAPKEITKGFPAYPPCVEAYKKAEADSSLKSGAAHKREDVDILSFTVQTLNYKEHKIPTPERDVLNFNPSTRTAHKDNPKYPSAWGEQVEKNICNSWHAGLRAASYCSSMGMIAAYMLKLCQAHVPALQAAGLSEEGYADMVGSDEGLDFILELQKLASCLGPLAYSAALECGTVGAAATLARRRMWLEAAGVKAEYCDGWMRHSTAAGQGLFALTPENIASYKAAQERTATVHKEMSHMMVKQPAPGSAGGRGGATNKGGAFDRAEWRKRFPQKKKKECNNRTQSASSTEPATKAVKPSDANTDAGKKPAAK